jgi:hypothetical protein
LLGDHLNAELPCRGFDGFQVARHPNIREGRRHRRTVLEDGEPSERRDRFLEELDAFGIEVARDDRDPGEVGMRTSQGHHEPVGHGVARDEHDGNRRRRLLSGFRRCTAVGDYDPRPQPEQLGNQRGESLGRAARVPLLDGDGASLRPTPLDQLVPERR